MPVCCRPTRRFLAAAAAPLLSSVVVISAYLTFAVLAPPTAEADLTGPATALGRLGWGTTAGVLVLALATLVPLARRGLRLRPRLTIRGGGPAVIGRIAAASLVGLVLQQISVLLISWASQQTADQGALTRFTWANAFYLLPYAVLAAPLLQTGLSAAGRRGGAGEPHVRRGACRDRAAGRGDGLARCRAAGRPRRCRWPGCSCSDRVPGRPAALAWPIVAFAPAVVGFTLLGLASRTLLAQHQARAAGLTTAIAWAVVIVAVLAAAAGGAGGVAGAGVRRRGLARHGRRRACVGWLLVRRCATAGAAACRADPADAGVAAAGAAAGRRAVGCGVGLLLSRRWAWSAARVGALGLAGGLRG